MPSGWPKQTNAPPTRMSAPAAAQAGPLTWSTPPSTVMEKASPRSRRSPASAPTRSGVRARKRCPEKPGSTPMTRTKSTQASTSSRTPRGWLGFSAAPGRMPSARRRSMNRRAKGVLSKWKETRSGASSASCSSQAKGFSTIRCRSMGIWGQ